MQLDKSLQQGVMDLMNIVNPQDAQTYTKNAILLSSITNPKIASSLTSLNQPNKYKNDYDQSKMRESSNRAPEIYTISKQLNTTIINTKNGLFPNPNDYPLSLLYFLTVYENTRLMFVILNEDSFEDQVLKICQHVSEVFKSEPTNVEAKNFIKSIGLVIENVLDLNQVNKYVDLCKKVKQSNKLDKAKHQLGIQFLNDVIDKKKIVLANIKKTIKQFIGDHEKIQNYRTSPKALTTLYKSLLNQAQISKLKQQTEKHYKQKSTQFLNDIKQAIQSKQIFNELPAKRKNAIQQEIEGKVQINVRFHTPGPSKKQLRRVQQFAVQSVYFILVGLYQYQEQLFKLISNGSYSNYNVKNEDNQWEQYDIVDLSVSGCILQKIFSMHTLYHNTQILAIANYFHLLFKLLENVPGLNIRNHELQNVEIIHIMIQKLIQFFYEQLDTRVKQFTKNKIQPIRLINLTDDIRQLIKFLEKFLKIDRKPYSDFAEDIRSRIVYIVSAFFFCSWKCYQIYQHFWSKEQINLFMVELDTILRNPWYYEYFQGFNKMQTAKIAIKINEYFGDLCFKNKDYFFAVKFYGKGRINSKLIKTYNIWFQVILQKEDLDHHNIQPSLAGIRKLAQLGLIQQARKWCYRFMDKMQQNTQCLSLLEDILDISKPENQKLMQQIASLRYYEINIVDKEVMDAISKELVFDDWLKRID